jgi:1-acyl-sn-glycerol-3-phosphate acyltransferase
MAIMLTIRSILFNIAFYLNLLFWMLVSIPTLVMPRKVFMGITKLWSLSSLWLARVIVGMKFELRGAQNIPKDGCIVVGKHQSAWEAFVLFSLFEDPCFILKRELAWIPLFGLYVLKSHMVPIDRKSGVRAMTTMNARALAAINSGRQIIIFAEGTRRSPGAEPAYKQGFSHLYSAIGVPILPLALNSGVFWPRRSFMRKPGTVVVEILPLVPAGLPRAQAQALVQEQIETASNRLLVEAGWQKPVAGNESAAS